MSNDGSVYDTTKYGWLQGRQVWTYCQLYTSLDRFKKQEILDAAVKGNLIFIFYVKPTWGQFYKSFTAGIFICVKMSKNGFGNENVIFL